MGRSFTSIRDAFRSRSDGLFGLLVVVALSVLLEVFVFNIGFFASLGYPDVESDYSINGVPASEFSGVTLTLDDPIFEITGLDDDVRSIHFSPQVTGPAVTDPAASPGIDGSEGLDTRVDDSEVIPGAEQLQITMSLTDEGNLKYYSLPKVSVDPDDPASCYINLDPAGKCHSIRVASYNLSKVGTVEISDISLNAHVPFLFDPIRFAAMLVVFSFLFALRPASRLHSLVFDIRSRPMAAIVVGLVAVQMVVLVVAVLNSTGLVTLTMEADNQNHFQYQKLAAALLQGQFYLDDVPTDVLQAMPNPYDTHARDLREAGALWDHAYFQGRYYVYFGILPCLVFYVPWLAVTGTAFPTWLGVAISLCLYAAGAAFLLYHIVRRWFPRTSLAMFVMLDILLVIAGGAMIPARTPSMYFLPEAFGMALVIWALGFWVYGTTGGRIRTWAVVVGSFLFAGTLATRPQMVLGVVFGLLLFVPFVRKVDARTRRRAYRSFAVAMLPFLIVGGAVMYYNYARFGSLLDFGANYNLTTNDMIHRGFHVNRVPYGLFAYLLQTPEIGSQFPFLHATYVDPGYQGVTITEPLYGGYFFLFPMTLIVLALPAVWRRLAQRRLAVPVVVSLVLALVLCIFDLQGAGILMRYYCDFTIYFALAAAVIYLELTQVPAVASADDRVMNATTLSIRRLTLGFAFFTFILTLALAVCLFKAFGFAM